jgi:hypothetical protein
MKQPQGEDITAMARQVAERIDESLRNGAPHPVIDGGPWEEPPSAVVNPPRGLMGKLADAVFYLITGRRRGDPFRFKQRD